MNLDRSLITVYLVVFSLLALTGPLAAQNEKPNFLFIFADDQCYEMVHALGNDEIETPNLDRLVKSGTTFTHAYNMGSWTGAVCVASRTMLNTGRSLWRAKRIHKDTEKERQAGRFWSEHLRKADYDTYFSGKWHVKADAKKAFDFVTHVRPGMPNQTKAGYDRPIEGQPIRWRPWDTQFGGFWKGGRHWSEVLGDDAIGYLEQAAKRSKSFFMYLAFNAPHDPRQSPKEYVDKYPLDKVQVPVNFLTEYPYRDAIACGRGLRDEKLAPFPRTEYAVKVNRQEYLAIVTHMDAQIGRILDSLEKTGKKENTWIFFAADHGLAVGHHGLLGKQNLYDHSVRVPFIVVGPGVARGARDDTPIYLQDVMPTTLELAGVPKPDHVEFKSLLPLLRDKRRAGYGPHYDAIYGAYLDVQRMVTMKVGGNRYKLLLYPRAGKARLYDLTADPLEMNDLAGDPKHASTTEKLFAKLLDLQQKTDDQLDLKSTSRFISMPPERKSEVTKANVDRWIQELSNWGRWGKNDQLGALNLITTDKRRQAAALVRDGVSVSLARNTLKEVADDNHLPFEHKMLSDGQDPASKWAADNYSVSYHGYAHTHMDSLCHIFYKGKIYNGFSMKEVTEKGAGKLGIHNVKNGIFTRGILIDIPRLKGVDYLEPRTAIYPEDLDAWEKKSGVRVSSGDVVFIRTGRWARRAEKGPWSADRVGAAGLHVSCAKWLRERDIAMLGSDAASDVLPSGVEGVSHPVHLLMLYAMGVHIFDNCDLGPLGEACAKRNRWEFLITASPIAVTGGTGSPLNPIATF